MINVVVDYETFKQFMNADCKISVNPETWSCKIYLTDIDSDVNFCINCDDQRLVGDGVFEEYQKENKNV